MQDYEKEIFNRAMRTLFKQHLVEQIDKNLKAEPTDVSFRMLGGMMIVRVTWYWAGETYTLSRSIGSLEFGGLEPEEYPARARKIAKGFKRQYETRIGTNEIQPGTQQGHTDGIAEVLAAE